MSKTVLIAESNGALIDALEFILSDSGFSVVGKTSKMLNVKNLAIKMKPDLLVFDLQLSEKGKSILTNLKPLKEKIPEMKILALGFDEAVDQFTNKIMKIGYDGFWNKHGKSSELINIANLMLY
jgi:DNA-binding NarL/FixJ family response regulator